ncbi:hypothetical protein BKA62DRAFT_717336 [Auriculariales sp. MPI-PUGE-AT-0066]|nr:hypothetical protein BKA62DRAFT_717336 [Auriculariales sp. MPI-PUGE-AT-0066]
MGDIAVPLITTDWVPGAQGYDGSFDFSSCPKAGLPATFDNDTSRLQSFDHLVQYKLGLPTVMNSWPYVGVFQFFGVLLYNDGSLVQSTSPTINAVWNGDAVAAQTWSAVPGNQCVYFEFQVKDAGYTVAPSNDPCNPAVAKLSFSGTDAARKDFEMVVTNAYLVGPPRAQETQSQGPSSSGLPASSQTISVCTRDPITTSTDSLVPGPTDSTPVTTSATSYSSARSTSLTSWSDRRHKSAAVAGIAAGSLAALFVILLSVAWLHRRVRRRQQQQENREAAVPFDSEGSVSPYPRSKEHHTTSSTTPSGRSADPVVEETGFRDFYSAMRRAGLTVQLLLEHHSGQRDRTPDRLPEYTAG